MDLVRLGRSELRVSPIAFGTWQLGGEWGRFDEQQAIEAIRHARSLGINFCGVERDSSPDFLRQGVEESLDALGVDHIDLYQVHWPDPDTPFAETGALLAELRDEGKIRHVGVSNYSAEQMAELSEAVPVETLQPPYHLFAREIEDSVLPWCLDNDVGVLVYGPLAHGLLTGAIDADAEFADDDWRSGSPLFNGTNLTQNLEVVRQLARLADEAGCTVGQLAIAWTLAHPAVGVAIVGSRSPEHIAESVGALDVQLTDADLQQIATVMQAAVGAEGPSPEMNSD